MQAVNTTFHLLVIFAAALLTACAAPLGQTCAQQAAPAITQLQSIAREWDDATKLANSTPRASLAAQIGNLQAIRRKTQDVEMPECANAVKAALVASMDSTINGFIAFLGQKPDSEVRGHFEQAAKSMTDFGKAIADLK